MPAYANVQESRRFCRHTVAMGLGYSTWHVAHDLDGTWRRVILRSIHRSMQRDWRSSMERARLPHRRLTIARHKEVQPLLRSIHNDASGTSVRDCCTCRQLSGVSISCDQEGARVGKDLARLCWVCGLAGCHTAIGGGAIVCVAGRVALHGLRALQTVTLDGGLVAYCYARR